MSSSDRNNREEIKIKREWTSELFNHDGDPDCEHKQEIFVDGLWVCVACGKQTISEATFNKITETMMKLADMRMYGKERGF